jgi:hypothetical protein
MLKQTGPVIERRLDENIKRVEAIVSIKICEERGGYGVK